MLVRSLVLFACLLGGATFVARAERPEPQVARSSLREFPYELEEGWRGVQEQPIADHVLAVLGVDDYLVRTYFTPSRSGVGLYIGWYGSQRQGDSIHSPQNCLPGAGWEPVSNSMLPITVTDGPRTDGISVNRYVIQKGAERQLVLYWYQTHGRVIASEYWAKYYLIRDAIRLNRTDGALIRVITPVSGPGGEAEAERRAIGFVKSMYPHLGQYLPV